MCKSECFASLQLFAGTEEQNKHFRSYGNVTIHESNALTAVKKCILEFLERVSALLSVPITACRISCSTTVRLKLEKQIRLQRVMPSGIKPGLRLDNKVEGSWSWNSRGQRTRKKEKKCLFRALHDFFGALFVGFDPGWNVFRVDSFFMVEQFLWFLHEE